ncbi:MAG: hypothetical protein HYW48_05035 [Deltaproteobacteria bacterium]|nr:hypothetical protein [Deltaproteobacteria bacterium]
MEEPAAQFPPNHLLAPKPCSQGASGVQRFRTSGGLDQCDRYHVTPLLATEGSPDILPFTSD